MCVILGAYNTFFPDSDVASYPLYLTLVLCLSTLSGLSWHSRTLLESYGITEDKKLEKMEEEELGRN